MNKLKGSLRNSLLMSIAAMICFALTGGECSELTVTQSVPDAIKGNWKLVLQTGAQQDICPDEIVNFQDNGIALLTCPNSQQLSREFSVSNDILTYTQTSVSYDIVFTNNQQTLELNGRNVSRNLTYNRQSDSHSTSTNLGESTSNSSELPEGGLR